MPNETLKVIDWELFETMRRNIGIDPAVMNSVRAKRNGGPEASPSQTLLPADKQDKAMMAVLKQADVLSAGWMV